MHGSTSGTGVDKTQVRLIHAALLAGLIFFAAVSLYLSGTGPKAPLSGTTAVVFQTVGYGLLVGTMIAVAFFRSRLTPRRAAADLDEWWLSNIAWAIIMWSLAEGGGLGGLIIGWQSHDRTLHISAVVVGLLLLLWCRPGSLEARR